MLVSGAPAITQYVIWINLRNGKMSTVHCPDPPLQLYYTKSGSSPSKKGRDSVLTFPGFLVLLELILVSSHC